METRNDSRDLYLVASTFLAGIYLIWQLIGLRFTNHDDIFFHLCSWVFNGNYFSFANYAAFSQSRLQAFINMPIILWVNHLESSVLYDLYNLGIFATLYASIIYFLTQITNLKCALVLATSSALLFPLHYYFTFPQAYPVMGPWTLTFVFISAGLAASNFTTPKSYKLFSSVILFTCSLWGPEYNFVLHPLIIIVAIISKLNKINCNILRQQFKLFLPFIIGWLISIISYCYFSFIARDKALDTVGRMSLNWDHIAWLKTFLILQEKSFLPLSLLNGINFGDARAQGGPAIPPVLNYLKILDGLQDRFSILIIFIVSFITYAVLLSFQTINRKYFYILFLIFASLTIIPCLVVSASSHYQDIVLKGYLQGHLISFYSQIGLSSLLFIISSYLVNLISKPKLRILISTIVVTVFAIFCTFTFVYNNINRQAMMANKQKWDAFRQLTSYVHKVRTDLKGQILHAPNFWSSTGVSSIPNDSPFSGINYWSEYSSKVLNQPIQIIKSEENNNIKVRVNYITTPEGHPIIIISENGKDRNIQQNTLLSTHPVIGKLKVSKDSTLIKEITKNDWSCHDQCTYDFVSDGPPDINSILFDASNTGPASLLKQFNIPRNNGYAHPFMINSRS